MFDDTTGSIPLDLAEQRTWPIGLLVGAMFAIFAAIAWTTIVGLSGSEVRDVFDLTFLLFQGFWVLGWSVGVAILGILTVLLLFYRESARLQGGRLVYVPRLGPLKVIIEYDLAAVPERMVDAVRRAQVAAGIAPSLHPIAQPARGKPIANDPLEARERAPELPRPSISSPSGLALIAANLVALGGVLFLGWDLASVMLLFWAESVVIGFYTVLKIAIVGKLAALFAAPFFVGHFGGFMAIHFLFIYSLFVRGIDAAGPEPGVGEALVRIFAPLWFSVATLFISHGVSFVSNFIGRREYARATVKGLMTAPYTRVVAMQVTLIAGGGILMLFRSPAPALALLVLLKTIADFSAHRREHATVKAQRQQQPSG